MYIFLFTAIPPDGAHEESDDEDNNKNADQRFSS